MELKLFLKIVRSQIKLFAVVWLVPVLLLWAYLAFLPKTFDVSLNLHITRQGGSGSADYQYADFYRLQADEKFADTLTEWLKNPRTVADIYEGAGRENKSLSFRKLKKAFYPAKMSSQLVVVSFNADSQLMGEKTAEALVGKVSQNISQLNADQKQSNWFEVIAEAPLIVKTQRSLPLMTLAAAVMGLILAIFTVLIRHYLED